MGNGKKIYHINESALAEVGGVATGMENLARYILKRCGMASQTDSFYKKSRTKRVFDVFYIPRNLLEKYSSLPIPEDCKRLRVVCKDINGAFAALGHNKFLGYTLYLPYSAFRKNPEKSGEFLEHLMHELTHLVNYNQKEKGGNVYSERSEIGEKTRKIVNDLVYYFEDSEMNAHLTAFYYDLKKTYELFRDRDDGNIWIQRKEGYGYCYGKEDLWKLKQTSHALGWMYMNSAINALRTEGEPRKECYSFSTFPKNGNKGLKWDVLGDYSNVYFAILYILTRFGKSMTFISERVRWTEEMGIRTIHSMT